MRVLDPNHAVVCLSGGLDSTYCLYHAKQKFEVVHAVSFIYGQVHTTELAAAARIAEGAGVASHEVVDLSQVFKTNSLLTGHGDIPKYASFEQAEQETKGADAPTFVPGRNSIFGVLAANRAMLLGAGAIVLGVCEADDAGYPDCRQAWVIALQNFLNAGLGFKGLQVFAPLMFMSKADTVRHAYHHLRPAYDAWRWSHTASGGR